MIIIETPAPPTRERLVLVPVGETHAHCRDATPEDLARAGWAPLAAFVGPLDMLTPPTLEGALEAIRHLADLERHAVGVAEDATREREEAIARAEKAERERDEARAELARLTAPVEGEPSGDELYATYGDHGDTDTCMRRIYRLGVAHERARQPAQDRATDEELERAYSVAYARAWESELSTPDRGERAGIRAVAAHVRGERCLIARAVAVGEGFSVTRRATGAGWRIRMVGGPGAECAPADVPATLARLLGEVSRG